VKAGGTERERRAPEQWTYQRPEKAISKQARRYEVAKILNRKRSSMGICYLVHWKGYSSDNDTWESEGNCAGCPDKIKQYEDSAAKRPTKKAVKKKKKAAKKVVKKVVTKGTAKGKATAKKAVRKITVGKITAKRPYPPAASPPKLVRVGSFSSGAGVSDLIDVDEGARHMMCDVLHETGARAYSASLKNVDASKNMDKYYVLQVLAKEVPGQPSLYWSHQRYGRSGNSGQSATLPCTKEDAIKAFEKKFKEKTGTDWPKKGKFAKSIPGKYWPITVKAQSNVAAGTWEYYQDKPMGDGSQPGWWPYHASAVPIVEGVYGEWKNNPAGGLNVRCVESGHFSYRVDFDAMMQTNLSTHKQRPIRRS